MAEFGIPDGFERWKGLREGVPNHELEGDYMIAWPSCHAWEAASLQVLSTALLGFVTSFIAAEIFKDDRWAYQGLALL